MIERTAARVQIHVFDVILLFISLSFNLLFFLFSGCKGIAIFGSRQEIIHIRHPLVATGLGISDKAVRSAFPVSRNVRITVKKSSIHHHDERCKSKTNFQNIKPKQLYITIYIIIATLRPFFYVQRYKKPPEKASSAPRKTFADGAGLNPG